MSPGSRTQPEILEEALAHLRFIPEYATQGFSSQMALDGMAMRLSVGLETLGALDAATRQRMCGELWPQMWSTRNRLDHAYSLTDSEIMRATILTDVPKLIAILEQEADGA